MKTKHIILIVIGVLLISITMFVFFLLSRIGYSSPEELMRLHPKVNCSKIYSCIESNDRVLVLYKGDSGNKKEIVYKINGQYYLFDYDTKPILWEFSGNVSIIVRSVEGKYTVEISGAAGEQTINNVSDSLGSDFEYQLVDYGDYCSQQWFFAIDEIPENYYINIDDEKIYVR